MNAEAFYVRFKQALDAMGVAWGDKKLANIWFEDSKMFLSYTDAFGFKHQVEVKLS